ncbi:MAG: DedA family protein [Alphaproteobacteria bacterium]|jgi:membrane protein DedA with SNARE-associated domain|nr:DedA family protein [Alphaproteobacteria bacterium]
MIEYIFSIINNITLIIELYGYIIILLLMMIESSFIPFPSEIIMIPAGYLASKGSLDISLVILSGVLGSILGASLNYFLAKIFCLKSLQKLGKYFFISNKRLIKVISFFDKHDTVSTSFGRLIPGIRQYISFAAGFSNMNFNKFLFFTFLGSSIWVSILSYIGFVFGNNQELIHTNLKQITLLTCLITASFLLIYVLLYRLRSKRFD